LPAIVVEKLIAKHQELLQINEPLRQEVSAAARQAELQLHQAHLEELVAEVPRIDQANAELKRATRITLTPYRGP
jgi:hypothetical protein